jgi:hypothetical protein
MLAFRNNVIWPHIYQEEAVGLHFMYYLDYLRVRKFRYPSTSSSSDAQSEGEVSSFSQPIKTKIAVGATLSNK